MNRKYNRMAAIITMVVLALGLVTCKKETIAPPTVKFFGDGQPSSVNITSASVSAEVSDQGGAEVKSRGFAYGLSGGSMDTIFCGSGTGAFSAELTGLQPNTMYVYEAFAKNAGGFGTSGKVTFTTRDHNMATVTTGEISNVGLTNAICGGNVTNDGGAEVTERGICWNTTSNPVVSGSHATADGGTGAFSCNLNNLSANTVYYVRAYAKNVKGVAYGDEKSFQTLDFDLPEVTTTNVTDITQTSAKGGGEVTSDGGATVTERGICWSTSHNPVVSGSHANSGSGTGSFTCNITGLTAHTTYYVRAYATNSKGTTYGDEVSFNTSANPPAVSTGSVTSITTTSATGSGNVTNDGGSIVIERGLCWSTHHEPTISGTHISAGEGTGEFTAAMTNLTANTTYYVRAYATNGVGISYGDEVQFSTLSVSIPGVTTASVTNIGNTSAIGGGNVISDGGTSVTERGICWSTSHNPTISGNHANSGTGTGAFTLNMTNLTPNTTYYVKAYAINSQGVAYGEEVNFKTSQTPTYTVSVSANPNNGGIVAGGGTYQQGQSCTVNATAATGYNFQKWTENGNQVSTNANYTFSVTSNRSLVAHFTTQPQTPTGAINGVFSVSANQRVYFSQGNLQYKASNNTWRFATNQYDYIGDANSNISSSYSGWIDLFGWGTSGWNCGNTYYRPWDSNNSDASLYGPPGSNNLTGSYANSDWGYYNAISNGGNQNHQWRTLTHEEWSYVFNTRSTSSGIRYAKAMVNNVNGVILLPDNWSSSYYTLYSTNNGDASFNSNVISSSTWTSSLQSHGAVFLPAAGSRYGSSVSSVGSYGGYWSASYNNSSGAYRVSFLDGYLFTDYYGSRFYGLSVRLVCPAW